MYSFNKCQSFFIADCRANGNAELYTDHDSQPSSGVIPEDVRKSLGNVSVNNALFLLILFIFDFFLLYYIVLTVFSFLLCGRVNKI